MKIRVLGSSAGGGLPQWNCGGRYSTRARQGDPGSAQAFMSADDELIRRFVPAWLQGRLKSAAALNGPGARYISQLAISSAQRAAQRMAFRQRRSVLQMDTWLEEALSFSGSSMRF